MIRSTSPWMTPELEGLRDAVSKFITSEFAPLEEKWCKQQHVDRSAWRAAGEMGLLCPSLPEQYGGQGADIRTEAVVFEEFVYAGVTSFGKHVHEICAHYILAYGTEEQKQNWLPGLASGELIGAIAMTEPGTGSDLQNIKTRAVREGDHYVVNGAKTFISNGAMADLIVVVVKTDPNLGSKGISLVVMDTRDLPGFRRGRVLDKMGQKGQDTSELFFDDVRLPVSCLLGGQEGQGFYQLMQQLPFERLVLALAAVANIERAVAITTEYVKERKAFGKAVLEFQNTRFKLAESLTEARLGRVFIDHCIDLFMKDQLDPVTVSMAKWWTTEKQCSVIDECLQLHGGYGYMNEYAICKMYTDARVQKIYGGTNEIMKELIARSL
ncbi:MAG: acyl-CoA dehydrogenase family protein [Burkholderiales bacterium]|nr:acyl-CoA dehydrogenase family protein [Burkholderiales bacterium]